MMPYCIPAYMPIRLAEGILGNLTDWCIREFGENWTLDMVRECKEVYLALIELQEVVGAHKECRPVDLKIFRDQDCPVLPRCREEVLRDLDMVEESYGEIYSQYRSEVSHFGDAWVGANDQISSLSYWIAHYQAELATYPPEPEPERKAYTPNLDEDGWDGSIPF